MIRYSTAGEYAELEACSMISDYTKIEDYSTKGALWIAAVALT